MINREEGRRRLRLNKYSLTSSEPLEATLLSVGVLRKVGFPEMCTIGASFGKGRLGPHLGPKGPFTVDDQVDEPTIPET